MQQQGSAFSALYLQPHVILCSGTLAWLSSSSTGIISYAITQTPPARHPTPTSGVAARLRPHRLCAVHDLTTCTRRRARRFQRHGGARHFRVGVAGVGWCLRTRVGSVRCESEIENGVTTEGCTSSGGGERRRWRAPRFEDAAGCISPSSRHILVCRSSPVSAPTVLASFGISLASGALSPSSSHAMLAAGPASVLTHPNGDKHTPPLSPTARRRPWRGPAPPGCGRSERRGVLAPEDGARCTARNGAVRTSRRARVASVDVIAHGDGMGIGGEVPDDSEEDAGVSICCCALSEQRMILVERVPSELSTLRVERSCCAMTSILVFEVLFHALACPVSGLSPRVTGKGEKVSTSRTSSRAYRSDKGAASARRRGAWGGLSACGYLGRSGYLAVSVLGRWGMAGACDIKRRGGTEREEGVRDGGSLARQSAGDSSRLPQKNQRGAFPSDVEP
ncbi:hypothetical protein C8R45DRAFT_924103 [Mycena sanguinolenta]|nr:hypothetical protein C8R45DRAFT_924103 [Mycena sanguinolenta]